MGHLLSLALSLRSRLVVLICLATLPAILFAFYIASNERSAALQRMEEDSRHIVSLISREHFYQIAGAKSLLRWLAGRLVDEAAVPDETALLPALLAGYPQLANIAILTPEGDVIGSAHPLPGPINMHDYDAIRRALESKDIEAGVYAIGPIVNKPILHLAYAVRTAEGAASRVVFVAIDLEWLSSLTQQVELPAEHILVIFDREGRILAGSAKPPSARIPPGSRIPELVQSEHKNGAMIEANIDGRIQTFATASIDGVPGVLIASGLPYGEIYREANKIFYRMIGLLFFLTLCTVFFVMLFEEVALIRYLRGLSRAMSRFGQGDFTSRAVIPFGKGELQDMARTFNTMAETLTARHHELKEAHDRLDLLARHLQVARESEAQRIARDLHDEAGQVLTSLKMDVADLLKKCGQCSLSGTASGTIQIDAAAMGDKIDHMIGFIRRLASALRPPVLDRMGLPAAIELLASDVEGNSDLAVEVEIADMPQTPGWLVSTALYRIVQEALTNIVRHAQASLARVELCSDDNGMTLVISDDGKGFNPAASEREALGIIGMRERAHLVGGIFSIEGTEGNGTIITVRVPYGNERDQNENPSG